MQNNQPKETLSFKIGLTGVFWDKLPEYSILLNDKVITQGKIESNIQPPGEQKTSVVSYIEFTADILEDSTNRLQIRLENKEDKDTVQNEDCTEILRDMLLNIVSIEIDDIPLDQLLWDKSEFVADDSTKPTLKRCVNLGWNGTYILEFTSPFYLWLLENI